MVFLPVSGDICRYSPDGFPMLCTFTDFLHGRNREVSSLLIKCLACHGRSSVLEIYRAGKGKCLYKALKTGQFVPVRLHPDCKAVKPLCKRRKR